MNKKGFTLIELLVVMGLLMVLMGTSIFGIEKISETTKLRNLKRIKIQIENATSVYFSENVIYEQKLLNKEEEVICTRLYILVQKGLVDKKLYNPFTNERIPANLCVNSKLNSDGVVVHNFDYIDELINEYGG